MNLPTRQELAEILRQHRVSRRLVRDIRYVPEEITHPDARDFLVVSTKSGNEGVLLYQEYVLVLTLKKRTANKGGRIEAIICDICATWQRGTNSAVVSLKKDDKTTVSYLVCGDLDCSLHVRDKTSESKLSRAHLRENITPDARIERLRANIKRICTIITTPKNA